MLHNLSERIESAVLLNSQDNLGQTPLHIAILQGDADMATALLDLRADPNLRDNSGAVAIDLAIDSDSLDLVRLLLTAR